MLTQIKGLEMINSEELSVFTLHKAVHPLR